MRFVGGLVKAVLVMNLLDALFTLAWVRSGLASEANLLLRDLVHEHDLGFVAFKLAVVSAGSGLLWYFRQHRAAVVGIFAAFLAYYWVLLYHLQFFGALVRSLL